jgi:hypothetical protein
VRVWELARNHLPKAVNGSWPLLTVSFFRIASRSCQRSRAGSPHHQHCQNGNRLCSFRLCRSYLFTSNDRYYASRPAESMQVQTRIGS